MTFYEENQILWKYRERNLKIECDLETIESHLAQIKEVQAVHPYYDFVLELGMEYEVSCAGMCGLVDDYEDKIPCLHLIGYENNDSILNRLQTSLVDSEQIDYQEIMEMRCLEEENPK